MSELDDAVASVRAADRLRALIAKMNDEAFRAEVERRGGADEAQWIVEFARGRVVVGRREAWWLDERHTRGVNSAYSFRVATGGTVRKGRNTLRVAVALVATSLLLAGCLTRYPYLTDPGTTSVNVNFATPGGSPAPEVRYGTTGSGCTGSTVTATGTAIQVNGQARTQWTAELTGLTADTEYCYRVLQDEKDLLGSDPSPTFRTAPEASDTDPFSFAVIGDWGAGSAAESAVLAQIGGSNADLLLTTGDNAYVFGTQTDWGDLLNNGRVFHPSRFWKQGANRPVFPTLGNHGFEDFDPHLLNFPQIDLVAASGGRFQADTYCCIASDPGTVTRGSLWYAFDWGPARFYILETAWSDLAANQYESDFEAHWNGPVPGCPACGTERDWLAADLADHAETTLKFAFFHYPLHSDALHGSDPFLTGPDSLEELLAGNGVDIVFNGHDHHYQRNNPTVADSNMVSYVTGGGGQFLYPVSGCGTTTAYAVGASGTSCNGPARTPASKVHHFLLVTVNGTDVTVTPTDSTGETFDVQTFDFSGP